MTFMMIAVGAFVTAMIFEQAEFAILGGVLGYLVSIIQQLKTRLASAENTLKKLAQKNNESDLDESKLPTADAAQKQPPRTTSKISQGPPERSDAALDSKGTTSAVSQQAPPRTNEHTTSSSKWNTSEEIQANHSNSVAPIGRKPEISIERATQPNFFEQAVSQTIILVKNYFTQGNLAVRIGAIILFFGVAFLLKYAAERGVFAIEYRLAATALTGIGLLIFGWRLRLRSDQYGLILQAIAIGVLYLTVFASYRLYHLLPGLLAFPLLIAISVLACFLAIRQNAKAVAIYGITGGFLAPILASTGEGSHVGLFSYYTVLNLGIFAIAWFKSWRVLNFVGFLFTFAIGAAWGAVKYEPQWLHSSEFFLSLFFVLYTLIATLYSNRQPPRLRGYVDGSLVFGLPVIYFGLQNGLLHDTEYGVAIASFLTGIFYAILSWGLLRKGSPAQFLLRPSFNALSIIFLSLTIPFALDGQWTAAAWAVEGAGLVWVGIKQQRWFAKYFGILLQPIGALLFIQEIIVDSKELTQIGSWLSVAMLSAAALFSAYNLKRYQTELSSNSSLMDGLKRFDPLLKLGFFIWAMFWWYIGGILNLMKWDTLPQLGDIFLVFSSVSAAMWIVLALRYNWQSMLNMRWVWVLFFVLSAQAYLSVNAHFLAGHGTWYWPIAIVVFYSSWYFQASLNLGSSNRTTTKSVYKEWNEPLLHLVSSIGLMALFLTEVNWHLDKLITQLFDWVYVVNGVILLALLVFLTQYRRWPFSASTVYQRVVAKIVLGLLGIWVIFAQFSRGSDFSGVFYLPIFNPLDLALVLIVGYLYWSTGSQSGRYQVNELTGLRSSESVRRRGLVGFCFVWITVILLRSLHHWQPVAYQLDSLFRSILVQTSVSILWSTLGVIAAMVAHRVQSRQIWIIAAGLISVVIIKLFTVDLASSGSIERIVSFLGVGGLLLVVGYFAPLPPKQDNENPNEKETEQS
jgi:uncharacterized membrane protein